MMYTYLRHSVFYSVSKKVALLMLVAMACFYCKNKEEQPQEEVQENPIEEHLVRVSTLEKGCYTYNASGSMVQFEITKTDNPVEGNLIYALAEKDKSIGVFKGTFNEGKLIGNYTFQSEGVESSRQVAFMLQDNQLIEGYGELNTDGISFTDVSTINYVSTMPLHKSDCIE